MAWKRGKIAGRILAARHGLSEVKLVKAGGRIQYQHADAKMQMRGWMNAVYGVGARLCSVARQTNKNALPRRSEVWLPNKPRCGPQGWGAENARTRRGRTRLLHVDEEVALEDVLPFLVLLGLFVRFVLPRATAKDGRGVFVSRKETENGAGESVLTYFQPSMVPHLQQ
jgi:hypothetical protein